MNPGSGITCAITDNADEYTASAFSSAWQSDAAVDVSDPDVPSQSVVAYGSAVGQEYDLALSVAYRSRLARRLDVVYVMVVDLVSVLESTPECDRRLGPGSPELLATAY